MITVLNGSKDWIWKTKDECLCGAILQVDSRSIREDYNYNNGNIHYYYYCPKCGRKNYIDDEKISSIPDEQRLHLKSNNDSWFSSGFSRL